MSKDSNKSEYVYIPDIPAQMVENNISTTIGKPLSAKLEEKEQEDLINERIKELKNVN